MTRRPWKDRWTDEATESLRRIPSLETATRIDAAVQAYAATGRGDVYRRPEDDVTKRRLRIGSYRVLLLVNSTERELGVLMVYRLR